MGRGSRGLTTKELSRESVYQHSFVEWNGTASNSGRKIETNCLMASIAGSGSDTLCAAGRGTDHWPSWLYGASGAGWKLVN